MSVQETLYHRLGGYDAIAAVVENLITRLRNDAILGRFWAHRGEDGIAREKQLLIDYLCANAGASLLYTGRDNKTSHHGMAISDKDWQIFILHLDDTLSFFQLPDREKKEVLTFIESTKNDIVEISG